MKVCTKCKVEKDKDLFCKNITRKDGFDNWCKVCVNKFRAIRKDVIKEYNAKYYIKNKGIVKERNKKYYACNRNKTLMIAKNLSVDCIQKMRERSRELYKKQSENLSYRYVINLIKQRTKLRTKDIPNSFVEAKRGQVLINRTLKEYKNAKYE